MKFKGIIFDLDGVICYTDKYHYKAWKALADKLVSGNVARRYKRRGAQNALKLKERGVKLAIGSSSKNTPLILGNTDTAKYFDAVADGNCITRSKPDPEVFVTQ